MIRAKKSAKAVQALLLKDVERIKARCEKAGFTMCVGIFGPGFSITSVWGISKDVVWLAGMCIHGIFEQANKEAKKEPK